MQGWIKLHRKIRENPIFNNSQLLRLWIICLTEASHKEHTILVGTQTVTLKPGEFVTGRFDLKEMYNSGLKTSEKVKGEKTVFRWLESLENAQYLTIKKTNKFSVVAINNWSSYQQDDQQMTNKRPTDDQQMTTNKNGKNGENGKKKDIDKKIKFAENVHMTQKQYDDLVAQYGKQVVDSKIEDMEIYKASKGKTYKNDGIALKGWLKKDNKLPQKQTPVTYQTDDSLFNPNLGED